MLHPRQVLLPLAVLAICLVLGWSARQLLTRSQIPPHDLRSPTGPVPAPAQAFAPASARAAPSGPSIPWQPAATPVPGETATTSILGRPWDSRLQVPTGPATITLGRLPQTPVDCVWRRIYQGPEATWSATLRFIARLGQSPSTATLTEVTWEQKRFPGPFQVGFTKGILAVQPQPPQPEVAQQLLETCRSLLFLAAQLPEGSLAQGALHDLAGESMQVAILDPSHLLFLASDLIHSGQTPAYPRAPGTYHEIHLDLSPSGAIRSAARISGHRDDLRRDLRRLDVQVADQSR